MIVESSFRGWEDARIVLSERGDFVVLGKNSCYNTKKQKGGNKDMRVYLCDCEENVKKMLTEAIELQPYFDVDHGVALEIQNSRRTAIRSHLNQKSVGLPIIHFHSYAEHCCM